MLFLQHCPDLHGESQLSDETGNGSVATTKRLMIIFANQFTVVNKEQHLRRMAQKIFQINHTIYNHQLKFAKEQVDVLPSKNQVLCT